MTYEIELTRSAKKALANEIPARYATAILNFILGPLRENPHRVGKKLVGAFDGYYSARRGDYRVIYQILEDRVLVMVESVAHRADAYRS
ncbi:MAG: hypothetical protein RL508_282 [Actinomycetota bacterium]